MSTLRRRHVASKRLLALVAAACVLGVAATSLAAAAPIYTDWSTPVNLGPVVNSAVSETGPALSPDGLSLYFYSNRPGGFGGDDIWVSQRADGERRLGSAGEPGTDDQLDVGRTPFPSFSADGHWMFFASDRPGGFGGADLYQSYRADIHDDFGWQTPTNLGATVNTAANDNGNGYFDNGGHPQLYFGSDRPGAGRERRPLHERRFRPTGPGAPRRWFPSSAAAALPTTGRRSATDGLEIFFYSDRAGGQATSDLWTATRGRHRRGLVDAGQPRRDREQQRRRRPPLISADAKTLFFSSTRTGTLGGNDLYMTTRAQIFPTTKDECKNGGWESFGIYKNQGDCVSYVATNGNNLAG